MRKKRPSKFEKGGLYIAICCFALIAAVIGYAGNKASDNNTKSDDAPQLASGAKTSDTSTKYNPDDIIVNIKDEPADTVQPKKAEAVPEQKAAAEEENITVSGKAEAVDPTFTSPVKGEILVGFSDTSLVYNEILSDWRTHNGVDIACDENAAIYASADGIVEEVYETAQGKTVRIDHKNGYKTVYANLSDQIEIITGDELKSGDLIGKAGSSSVADFTQKPHLHFEIILNDEYVNPEDYIN